MWLTVLALPQFLQLQLSCNANSARDAVSYDGYNTILPIAQMNTVITAAKITKPRFMYTGRRNSEGQCVGVSQRLDLVACEMWRSQILSR